MIQAPEPIVLYDGVCGLCDRFVQFVLTRDSSGRVKFAQLQSERGKDLLRKFGLPEKELSFVVLVEGERCSVKSSAVLRTLRYLDGPWRAASFLRIVPPIISDAMYDFVARNRYSWFGKYDVCVIPDKGMMNRFLE